MNFTVIRLVNVSDPVREPTTEKFTLWTVNKSLFEFLLETYEVHSKIRPLDKSNYFRCLCFQLESFKQLGCFELKKGFAAKLLLSAKLSFENWLILQTTKPINVAECHKILVTRNF